MAKVMQLRFKLYFLLVALLVMPATLYATPAESKNEQSNLYTVTKAIDGDTMELSNGERVRLIGIDTPESADNPKLRRDTKKTGQDRSEIIKMGIEAAEFTRSLVEGKQVRLEYDVQRKDKYGRILAYVWYQDESKSLGQPVPGLTQPWIKRSVEVMLNEKIILEGYASPMTIPPDVKYAELFQKLYREAREAKRGLWRVS